MTYIDWEAVEAMFQAALDLPASERADLLADGCADLPHVRAQVESLLEAHDASTRFLVAVDIAEGAPEPLQVPAVGMQVGAYRLVRELGHGGMGIVFLAARADGDFDHDVAIKVTRSPVSDPLVARRFQRERQALASLHHPHIVTLLDGGSLATGHAYLVMEYVDGSRVTDWVRDRSASLEQRLRVFRQVCSAVVVAHQHGIVHRDIKPANILVSADGVPKVLDFGIATLLSVEGEPDVTREGWGRGPLTPDYASPEQLRGLPATTAADVYSLGVLLHELLTGVRPYDTTGKSADQVLAQVLGGPVSRASASVVADAVPYPATRLRGDLDAIVQKALRADPAERYSSAESLADDVARFLGGKTVSAREPSLGDVLRKFSAHHRGAVVAAVLAVLGITAALALALWQRQQAVQQRVRAEARFEDVQSLANTLIVTIHDAVARLDGSTEARKLIVSEALGYLNTLATDSRETRLQLDLAKGYTQIARAQGHAQGPNLGDYAGAHASLMRATGLLQGLLSSPLWREAGLEMVQTLRLRSDVERSLGRRPESQHTARLALTHAEALLARTSDDDQMRRTVASAHFNVAMSMARSPAAAAHWEAAGALFEALLAAAPRDQDRMRNVALVDKYYGAHLIGSGRTADGVSRYARALELDQQRLATQPANRQAQFDVAIDLANVGAGLALAGRHNEAFPYYERSLAMREAILSADPANRTARLVLIRVLANAARVADLAGLTPRVRAYLARARAVAAADATLLADQQYQKDLAILLRLEARQAHADGQSARACQHLARAVTLEARTPAGDERDASDQAWAGATARLIGPCPG